MSLVANAFTNLEHETAYGGQLPILKALRKEQELIKLDDVSRDLSELDSYTKHRYVSRRFPRMHVWAPYIGFRVEIDLLSMERYASDNDDIKYLFCVVDQFSRMAYCQPLKSKRPAEVARAFEIIKKQMPCKVQSIYCDAGNEFKGMFAKAFAAASINKITATSWVKCSIVERFQKTLKLRVIRHMRNSHSFAYLKYLQDIVSAINNTYNRTIRTAPSLVNFQNQHKLYSTYYRPLTQLQGKRATHKHAVGADVIVALKQATFKRGYHQNFTDEVFRIKEALPTYPLTYVLEDRKKRQLPRKYYERELQAVRFPVDYLYDLEVLKTAGKGRNAKSLVHFLTQPEDDTEWISTATLHKYRTHGQLSS